MKASEANKSQGQFCKIDEHIIFLDRDFYQTECGAIVKPDDETCPRCARGFGPDLVRNVAGKLTGPFRYCPGCGTPIDTKGDKQ